MAVSKETAAALAARYPHLADQAAGAVSLGVEEQHANVRGKRVVIDRYERFRLASGSVVPLPVATVAVAPPVAAPVAAPVADVITEAVVQGLVETPAPEPLPVVEPAHHHGGHQSKKK